MVKIDSSQLEKFNANPDRKLYDEMTSEFNKWVNSHDGRRPDYNSKSKKERLLAELYVSLLKIDSDRKFTLAVLNNVRLISGSKLDSKNQWERVFAKITKSRHNSMIGVPLSKIKQVEYNTRSIINLLMDDERPDSKSKNTWEKFIYDTFQGWMFE